MNRKALLLLCMGLVIGGLVLTGCDKKPEPAADTRIKTAWHMAKVGDKLKFKGTGTEMIWEVTKVDENTAHVKVTTLIRNLRPAMHVMKMPRYATAGAGKAKAGVEIKELAPETLTVGTMKINCKVTQTKMKMGDKAMTSKSWTSDQVPGGTVKMMSGQTGAMQTTMELVEFTRGG